MTEPQVSVGQMLMSLPCELGTNLVDTPQGQRLAVTVRTPAGEARVVLSKEDAAEWGRVLTREASKMSSSGLIVAPPGTVVQMNGNQNGAPN
jgi:hypothetical protein